MISIVPRLNSQRRRWAEYLENIVNLQVEKEESVDFCMVIAAHYGFSVDGQEMPFFDSDESTTLVNWNEVLNLLCEMETWTWAPYEDHKKELITLFSYMLKWSHVTGDAIWSTYANFITDIDHQFLITVRDALSGNAQGDKSFQELGNQIRLLIPYLVRDLATSKSSLENK